MVTKHNIMIIQFCLLADILHPLIYLSLKANSPPTNFSITCIQHIIDSPELPQIALSSVFRGTVFSIP
jgi:hypothetical protein